MFGVRRPWAGPLGALARLVLVGPPMGATVVAVLGAARLPPVGATVAVDGLAVPVGALGGTVLVGGTAVAAAEAAGRRPSPGRALGFALAYLGVQSVLVVPLLALPVPPPVRSAAGAVVALALATGLGFRLGPRTAAARAAAGLRRVAWRGEGPPE